MRTYWFEIFECGRKIGLIGLPVFFPEGSAVQRILGLVICFLSYGLCMLHRFIPWLSDSYQRPLNPLIGVCLNPCAADSMYAPYSDPSDDLLAQCSQIAIFLSMLASLVTDAYPVRAWRTEPALAHTSSYPSPRLSPSSRIPSFICLPPI